MKKRSRSHGRTKKKSLNINFKQILIFVISFVFVGYTVYFSVVYAGISTYDPTESNGSQYYLLSQSKDSFKTTLWIFEKGSELDRKIDKVFLHVYNEEKEQSLLVYVPSWLYFSGLEEDFGNAISVSSFRYAGDFIQEGRGVEYTLWQLSQMLGIKVDDYIWMTPEALELYENAYGEIKGNSASLVNSYDNPNQTTEDFLYLQKFLNTYSMSKSYLKISEIQNIDEGVFSDMPFRSVLANLRKTKKVLSNIDTFAIDLGYAGNSSEKMSDVGGMVNYFDSTIFDDQYRDLIEKMIDRELEKERVRVEVYNGSGVSGAARQFGRKVENSGCNVVRYENAPKTTEKTIVYVPNLESFTNSFEIVKETLSGRYELVEGRPSFMTTGDIVIVLGEDIKQMYSF
jgi:hypothetical protein